MTDVKVVGTSSDVERGAGNQALKRRLLQALADTIISHADELTSLDSAIGDGDHGHNMKRGFEAVLGDLDALSLMEFPDLFKAVGNKLVLKVGGASGPLYGTLFLALGKALPPNPSRAATSTAFSTAVDAVRARGKSDAGQKTLLDVLVPASRAFAAGADLNELKRVAEQAEDATKPMRATRGRASFLGERSIGHIDPGARSSSLMIAAVCDALGEP